jgi:hypothetical protein
MIDYEYYHDQYRRVPKNPSNIRKELLEYNSTISATAFNAWSNSIKRRMTTTYIDGSTLLSGHERPYTAKDLFPKGKGRRKSLVPCEKKIVNKD